MEVGWAEEGGDGEVVKVVREKEGEEVVRGVVGR